MRHPALKGKSPAQCTQLVETLCDTAEHCAEVQSSPIAAPALAALKTALVATQASLGARMSLAQALLAAIKALHVDVIKLKSALGTYASAVEGLAQGDAVVIARAGLLSREPGGHAEALDRVAGVTTRPGKNACRSDRELAGGRRGAQSYAIEVNVSGDPAAAGTALKSGTRRRRVIKAPVAGGQLLVRVASLAGDGTQAEWSDWILATAR